jgi:hypothetical protein
MTTIGKVLVYVTVLLSGLFLAFAVAVYSQRLPWFTYTPEGGEKVVGIIDQAREEMARIIEARNLAEVRWAANANRLQALDRLVPQRRAFYANTLKAMTDGTDSAGMAVRIPVQQFPKDEDRDGLADLKPTDVAVKINDADALALKAYAREIDARQADIKALQDEFVKLVDEEKKLTEKLNGYTADGMMVKGLRQLLAEQEDFARRLRDEQDHLQPQLANRWAEAQLLLKRNALLEARKAELKKAATATAASGEAQ